MQSSPRFGYLLRLGLESIGVHYVPIDLLRKASKKQTTEREYWILWRLLHDLVLVVLADFEIDKREMERLNEAETLENTLLDADLHKMQMELVQYYLYDWGFVCTAFYSNTECPSSQVLLIAVAWLLAFSKFFERQYPSILARCTGIDEPCLPPFPNDVGISSESARKAAAEVLSTAVGPCDTKLPLDGQMHQLHSAFGRLQGHVDEVEAYVRYHQRLLKRLEAMQNLSEACQDDMIPAYVLDLLAGPTERLNQQVQVVAQGVQMKKDEALFYKWIHGLVLAFADSSNPPDFEEDSNAVPDTLPAALHAEIQKVQTLFQAHGETIQEVEQSYKDEWTKWRSRQKSRSRVERMETRVATFTHKIQTEELFDPQKLFLRSQRSWETSATSHVPKSVEDKRVATDVDVDRLQSQIASVITDLTQVFCRLQLR